MWHFLFWASIGTILYSYLGYAVALYVMGLFRRRREARANEASLPSICLVISAFNEEKVIRQKIENSLTLEYPREKKRILVASDGSIDRTVAIARDYDDLGIEVFESKLRTGKSAVLNDVIAERTEDVIVFTDANSLFEIDALTKLCERFADPEVGCVVGRLCYLEEGRSTVGRSESAYWRYEGIMSRLESRIGSVLVANGSIFAARRSLIAELYPEVANDFQIPMDVAAAGGRVVYEPAALALEHSARHWHEEFGRKSRIILRGLTGFGLLRGRIPGLRMWQFWSHKMLRWMVGVFLFLALIANIALAGSATFYTATLVGQLLFYLAAFAGWRRKSATRMKLLYIPFYFVMVNAAALIAMLRYLVGQRQAVWEIAESTRTEQPVAHTPSRDAGEPAAAGAGIGRGGVEAVKR